MSDRPEYDDGFHQAREVMVAEFETDYARWLLKTSGGNMSLASRIAKIDRTTVYRLFERAGVHRSQLTYAVSQPA